MCISHSGATELLKKLPTAAPEKTHMELIKAWYKECLVPSFLQKWVAVPIKGRYHGLFYVLPDYLCVGTDDDYVYTPMGAVFAEGVLDFYDAVLPTRKMVDAIYASSAKQVAQPWGPPYNHTMQHVSRWVVQTAKIRKAMGGAPTGLVEGHMKNVIVSAKAMASKGVSLGFYGWFDKAGKPIQGDSLAHEESYCDYSHGVRAVLKTVQVDGKLMTLEEALAHPEYHTVFSDHGRIVPASYRKVRGML